MTGTPQNIFKKIKVIYAQEGTNLFLVIIWQKKKKRLKDKEQGEYNLTFLPRLIRI